jgi:cytochrome b6-f complex iron-sulfur subunit
MDRQEFLAQAGRLAACLCLAGCGNTSGGLVAVPEVPKTDFSLDLAQAKFADLQRIGGSVYENLILVVRTGQAEFVAVTQYCTHSAGVLAYVPATQIFRCPVHQSAFDLAGRVLEGPAMRPLKRYQTELRGNLLRVFE